MRKMMKTPVGLVSAALMAAILLAASLVIVTGTRGQETAFPSPKQGSPVAPPAAK